MVKTGLLGALRHRTKFVSGPVACSPRLHFATSPTAQVKLAYDLWKPPEEGQPDLIKNPIIFIHGLFGSKRNNRSISKALARDLHRPIYAIDCRNHGDSPHNSRHDYTALAEDVEEFIKDHKLSGVTIIGHSMGAKTAMTVALRRRAPVENMIAVDNAPVDAALMSDFAKYVQGMKKIEEANVHKQRDADQILQSFEENLPIRQFLLSNLVRPSNHSLGLKFRVPIKILSSALDNMADFPFKDPNEARFEKPSLFVRGTKSHYVSDETLPIIGRFFPTFELRDIDTGHWVISENPTAFHDVVVEFLEDKA